MIYAAEGDYVRADFSRVRGGDPVSGIVAKVTPRYARLNHGQTKQNPLITLTSGRSFDASFVVEVDRIKRGKGIRQPRNIFRDKAPRMCVKFFRHPGIFQLSWHGDLRNLAERALAKLPHQIERPIYIVRLEALFDKFREQAGFVRITSDGKMIVKKRKFERWIGQNWSRVILTVDELREMEQEKQDAYEATIEADYAVDEIQSFNDSIDPFYDPDMAGFNDL